jgi:hypothetical protein
MVGATTSLHGDNAARKLAYKINQRVSPDTPAEDDGSAAVQADHAAYILPEIDAEH